MIQASIADFVNTEARECGAVESPNYQQQNIKDCVARIVDTLRAQLLSLSQKLQGAEMDKGRLDWLEKHYRTEGAFDWFNHPGDIRGAIDDAGFRAARRSPNSPRAMQEDKGGESKP